MSPTAGAWDAALARLEDYLAAYPADRALPDLDTLLRDAGVPEEFLRQDERALKVLHEAVLSRPLSSHDAVARVRTEVELLTLEVEVLTERLRDPATGDAEVAQARTRLEEVRRRLEEIRAEL